MQQSKEKYLITAGGKIKCHRCQARSSRTKLQCAKPALRNKRVCGHHGGLSTGPRTQEGIKRIQAANWKHGNETKEARAERSKKSLMFLMLEEIGHHVNLFAPGSTKTRGRKPRGYPYTLTNLYDEVQLKQAITYTIHKHDT